MKYARIKILVSLVGFLSNASADTDIVLNTLQAQGLLKNAIVTVVDKVEGKCFTNDFVAEAKAKEMLVKAGIEVNEGVENIRLCLR